MFKKIKSGNNDNNISLYLREEIIIIQLSTFEDIYNKLIKDYCGKSVEINTKQNGLTITTFETHIDKIIIRPFNKKSSKKWSDNKKVGLIIIQKRKKNKLSSTIKIPFILGFDTMTTTFLKQGVNIKTLDMEFNIKKLSDKKYKRNYAAAN